VTSLGCPAESRKRGDVRRLKACDSADVVPLAIDALMDDHFTERVRRERSTGRDGDRLVVRSHQAEGLGWTHKEAAGIDPQTDMTVRVYEARARERARCDPQLSSLRGLVLSKRISHCSLPAPGILRCRASSPRRNTR